MPRTSNPALQAKLDSLAALAAAGDREAFARAFVPLDLSEEDLTRYVNDLRDDGTWRNLVAEIAALAGGGTVISIAGDQTSSATFAFPHPLQPRCDREVVFVCSAGEWRAEG
jgi:hypothetical protein